MADQASYPGNAADAVRPLPAVKYALISLLFLSLLAWYLYPVAAIALFWRDTAYFQNDSVGLQAFAAAIGNDHLGLNELPKLLIGLVSSSGLCLMLMERKSAGRIAEAFAVFLLALLLFSAFACVFTYHVLLLSSGVIDNMYDPDISSPLLGQVASRFRELWTLIGALAGLTIVYERTAREST
jgi:hypothetical protein